ncbi:hypothetical protein GGF42_001946 [Coemansia sp. RSA 2424]|nr:hypothetical protein GGF42_001946 [Coemansia sp. RSA 2424]
MESTKQSASPLRRSSSPPTPPHAQRQRKPVNLSQISVQCLDPELKREALSELFDHCMSPISGNGGTLPPSALRCMSSPGLLGKDRARTRPLSAAPMLVLDAVTRQQPATEPVNTGLMSPASPLPGSAELAFYGDYYEDEDYDDDDGSEQEMHENTLPPALGTFADLRRKLYGGDVHGTATTAEA